MGGADLAQVLRFLPTPTDSHLLGNFAGLDDAAVYRLSDDQALVLSVDYITPVLDDPYTFGAVAAANALSDLYAMGARPLLALNLVGFPAKTLPLSTLGEIVRGGSDKVREAGAWVVGGHSIEDYEPKYGLVVAGLVHPEEIVRNSGAQPGDRLVLTKPLGIGIITTGIDRGLVGEKTVAQVTSVMATLNKGAAEAMRKAGVHAATDITGFGLLGHLHELLSASGVGARIWYDRVPVLDEAWELAARQCVPEGTYNNFRYLQDSVTWTPDVSHPALLMLCDAQTSGGLLLAVPPERTEDLLAALGGATTPVTAVIGEVTEAPVGRIYIERSAFMA
ncbi:MAG: selenide, water dikinase SelD [Ardenticatenaceae bacterium]|nr:selenide, water dikinase SelD [Ardenticatenaceae bacterium]